MFFVIEGADGTGKSTLANALSTSTGGVVVNAPSARLKPYKLWIDANASGSLHYRFYKKCMADLSAEAKLFVSNGSVVLADRYWYSTVATHRALGVQCEATEFDGCLRPDIVLYLIADPSVRGTRMKSRGLDQNDLRMLDTHQELARHFDELLPEMTRIIDTTFLDVRDMVAAALEMLRESVPNRTASHAQGVAHGVLLS